MADGLSARSGVGLQALFAPRSFYDDFPIGRGWVAMDGPYNQHLVRDVGSLNLALVVLVFAALVVVDPRAGAHDGDRVARQRGPALHVPPESHGNDGMEAADKAGIVVTLGWRSCCPVLLLLVDPDRRSRQLVADDTRTRSVKV